MINALNIPVGRLFEGEHSTYLRIEGGAVSLDARKSFLPVTRLAYWAVQPLPEDYSVRVGGRF